MESDISMGSFVPLTDNELEQVIAEFEKSRSSGKQVRRVVKVDAFRAELDPFGSNWSWLTNSDGAIVYKADLEEFDWRSRPLLEDSVENALAEVLTRSKPTNKLFISNRHLTNTVARRFYPAGMQHTPTLQFYEVVATAIQEVIDAEATHPSVEPEPGDSDRITEPLSIIFARLYPKRASGSISRLHSGYEPRLSIFRLWAFAGRTPKEIASLLELDPTEVELELTKAKASYL